MKEHFKDIKFRQESLDRIDLCNTIIDDYQTQGLRLTLRQLYYQLVSRDVIANSEKSYKSLGGLVSDARLVAKFGNSSWEVDALPPQELARIIRRSFEAVVDLDLMDEVKEREREDKEKLMKAVEQIMAEKKEE